MRAGIFGVGAALPEWRIANDHFAARLETSDEWIVRRTGIRERRWLNGKQTLADLASDACAQALEDAGRSPDDVDHLIVSTITADRITVFDRANKPFFVVNYKLDTARTPNEINMEMADGPNRGQVARGIENVLALLVKLQPADLDRTINMRGRGEVTVRWALENLLVEHLEEHCNQLYALTTKG